MDVSRSWMPSGVGLSLSGAGRIFAEEPVGITGLVPPGPNRPDEPFLEEFSLSKTVQLLDSVAITRQKEQSSFAFVSNDAFLLARPAFTCQASAAAQIRAAREHLARHPRETAHQCMDGHWFTASMRRDSDHYITYPGTAYAVHALSACGETDPAGKTEWFQRIKTGANWATRTSKSPGHSESYDRMPLMPWSENRRRIPCFGSIGQSR